MAALARQRTAGRVIDQAALGEPLPWRLDEHENSLGNLGSCGTPHQLAAIMKNRLKRIEYRPDLINGFLSQTGLSLESGPP